MVVMVIGVCVITDFMISIQSVMMDILITSRTSSWFYIGYISGVSHSIPRGRLELVYGRRHVVGSSALPIFAFSISPSESALSDPLHGYSTFQQEGLAKGD